MGECACGEFGLLILALSILKEGRKEGRKEERKEVGQQVASEKGPECPIGKKIGKDPSETDKGRDDFFDISLSLQLNLETLSKLFRS